MEYDNLNRQAQWMFACGLDDEHFVQTDRPYDFVLLLNGKPIDLNRFANKIFNLIEERANQRAAIIAEEIAVSKSEVYQELLNRMYQAQSELNMAVGSMSEAIGTISNHLYSEDGE